LRARQIALAEVTVAVRSRPGSSPFPIASPSHPSIFAVTSELERRGVIAELASSNRVTRWAYSQTEGAGGLTWLRADEMAPLTATWRDLIQPFSEM
jgi:hypothetical protein